MAATKYSTNEDPPCRTRLGAGTPKLPNSSSVGISVRFQGCFRGLRREASVAESKTCVSEVFRRLLRVPRREYFLSRWPPCRPLSTSARQAVADLRVAREGQTLYSTVDVTHLARPLGRGRSSKCRFVIKSSTFSEHNWHVRCFPEIPHPTRKPPRKMVNTPVKLRVVYGCRVGGPGTSLVVRFSIGRPGLRISNSCACWTLAR